MLYNINPNLWGPSCWKFIHYLTMAYPDNPSHEEKQAIKNFIYSLGKVLPCENCRVHFAMNLENFPLTENVLSSKYNLINWAREVHNEVNTRKNKKNWSYQEVIKEYSPKNDLNCNTVELVTISLLVLIMIILVLYMKIK